MLSSVMRELVQRSVDLARIDVFAADGEHVVDAAENSMRQARICAAARIFIVGPKRKIAREQADHRLRRSLKMRIDRRDARPEGNAANRMGGEDSGVKE